MVMASELTFERSVTLVGRKFSGVLKGSEFAIVNGKQIIMLRNRHSDSNNSCTKFFCDTDYQGGRVATTPREFAFSFTYHIL